MLVEVWGERLVATESLGAETKGDGRGDQFGDIYLKCFRKTRCVAMVEKRTEAYAATDQPVITPFSVCGRGAVLRKSILFVSLSGHESKTDEKQYGC